MKTAAELCTPDEGSRWFSPCGYDAILSNIGTIALQVDDDDYQGDSRVLYREGSRWGWLQFGWGSCSGCDALQSCDSVAEVQKLMDELRDSVRWFDSAAEALKFFREHDWKGDYSWHGAEQKDFVTKAIAMLEAA